MFNDSRREKNHKAINNVESRKQILKIIGLFSGVQGLSMLLNLVRAKLAALLLGPAGIGLNSIFNEMREFIHTTTNVGLDVSGIRQVSIAYENDDTAGVEEAVCITRSWVLLLSLFGMLVCMLLAQPLSWITFSDFNHTWDFVMLSPAIAFSSLTCGEAAILKGLRRLKVLAMISLLNVIGAILTTIPMYYFFGMKGIVPALVLMTAAMYLISISASWRIAPLRLSVNREGMKKGVPMLAVGFSFVLAGMVSHGSELAIRTYLNNVGSLEIVGLYSAGYSIVMTYGGVAFASLETDFFPRLSGIFSDGRQRQLTVLRQAEVLISVMTPVVVLMIILLPLIVPLLFSSEFMALVPMARIAALGLLFRSVYLPFAYVTLAAGDSRNFFVLEAISYAVILGGVILGYNLAGLFGTGVALAVSNLVDLLVTSAFTAYKYNVRPSARLWLCLALTTALSMAVYMVMQMVE